MATQGIKHDDIRNLFGDILEDNPYGARLLMIAYPHFQKKGKIKN